MGMLDVDTSNPDLFKPPVFKVLIKGKWPLEVANDLEVVPAKNSDNNVINIELRCQDEGEQKGAVVFDTITIITDATTEKGTKAKKIQEAKLCQFAIACGVMTKEEIEQGQPIDLSMFKGRVCEAITKVVPYVDPNSGESKEKAAVARYLFEQEDAAQGS